MKVFKFGGASVKDAKAIQNVAQILKSYQGQKIMVVVSAIGKMTNALEEVVKAYFKDRDDAFAKLEQIKKDHFSILEALFPDKDNVFALVNDIFVEVEWVLEDDPHDPYDYIYDQIVSVGELVSSRILMAYLKLQGISCDWQDARDVLRTDDTYRDGNVDWEITRNAIQKKVKPRFEKVDVLVTQGFIGSTSENNTTTLGREGSDYTAAIFSFCLDVESMNIWKDVPGVLTGDPRIFENVTKIEQLSYREAIEMTYYGAKVIHPKTIKPLQNKQIPLHVRSFIDSTKNGTIVGDFPEENYPPIVVVANDQALLNISAKDFSFIAEHHLSHLFSMFAKFRIKINMMRNTAISFSVCVKNHSYRLQQLTDALQETYNISTIENLELITVRHFNEVTLEPLRRGRVVMLEETSKGTIQMVVKMVPVMARKI